MPGKGNIAQGFLKFLNILKFIVTSAILVDYRGNSIRRLSKGYFSNVLSQLTHSFRKSSYPSVLFIVPVTMFNWLGESLDISLFFNDDIVMDD